VSVLVFSHVTLRRGSREILHDLNWQVQAGQRWVILGPNGAGKTTLIQIAATFLHPTSGTVEILDERLGRVDIFELRPRIGLASAALSDRIPPEERAVDVVMTAAYAVTGRWREIYDLWDESRALALLEQFGVGDRKDQLFYTLSEGERKRVQIARALMPDPELLILDEPAAGLDLGAREDLVRRLSTLALDPSSPTSVLVTHHVEEIPYGTTHLLLIREGNIVAAGPIAATLTGDALSAAFGIPISLSYDGQRWFARA
jgi:iron complex transport system ATP-binding protein